MQVQTSRFGTLSIPEDRVINFPKGLLGFGEHRRFCLLEPADDACFYWLQSCDDPELAFVITDPTMFVGDYNVPIREEQMTELKLSTLTDAQVFVIVNKVDQVLTGNFQGPLVINTLNKQGEQFVLAEKRWTTRQPLVRLGEQLRPAKSA